MKTDKFKSVVFQSSFGPTDQFDAFSRAFMHDVRKVLPKQQGYEVNLKKGHFFVTGFISSGDTHVYLSISDVRAFPRDWHNKILIRTAKHTKDFTGGTNRYCTLINLKSTVIKLLAEQHEAA